MMSAQLQQPFEGSASNNDSHVATAAAEPEPAAPIQNRASASRSPYVQAHATSPVAWQLFDDEALSRAKRENKLMFVHVGFAACHCKMFPSLPVPRFLLPRTSAPLPPFLSRLSPLTVQRTLAQTATSPTKIPSPTLP